MALTVADEGVGIAPDELPFIFSKYAAISSKPTAGEASTGLGLSIVKRLAEEIGAEVQVSSEENSGSIFTVSFS